MTKTLMFCVLCSASVAGLVDLPDPVDVYHMARAIEGEGAALACPNLDSKECQDVADRVGQVVINRLRAGWCTTVKQCVNGGFWGAERVLFPQPWAMKAATRVLHGRETTDDFYVFSVSDVKKLALEKKEANYSYVNDKWGLFFYGPETQW